MKQLIAALSLAILFAGCGSNQPAPDAKNAPSNGAEQKLEPTILKNYFLLNTVTVKERQCFLMSGPAEFDGMFGLARTMKNEIVTPNFDSSFVGAIAVPPTNRLTDFRITKIVASHDTASVHFEIIQGDDQLTWTSQPVLVFSFPKDPAIRTVRFVQTGVPLTWFPAPSAGSGNSGHEGEFTDLPNYFFKKTVYSGKLPSYQVISDTVGYHANLFAPKGTNLSIPDFSRNLVLMVVYPETQKATEIRLLSTSLEGDNLNVVLSKHEGGDLSFSMWPNVVASVPREGVKTVTFYNGAQKLATVPVSK